MVLFSTDRHLAVFELVGCTGSFCLYLYVAGSRFSLPFEYFFSKFSVCVTDVSRSTTLVFYENDDA